MSTGGLGGGLDHLLPSGHPAWWICRHSGWSRCRRPVFWLQWRQVPLRDRRIRDSPPQADSSRRMLCGGGWRALSAGSGGIIPDRREVERERGGTAVRALYHQGTPSGPRAVPPPRPGGAWPDYPVCFIHLALAFLSGTYFLIRVGAYLPEDLRRRRAVASSAAARPCCPKLL